MKKNIIITLLTEKSTRKHDNNEAACSVSNGHPNAHMEEKVRFEFTSIKILIFK